MVVTFSASIEYTDAPGVENITGYQTAVFGAAGIVQFIWDDELLTIPLHRIKSISETSSIEGGLYT